MAKYVYPAIFTPEEEGGYFINFPDLEGCYTCGNDLTDGMEMAEDVLSLVLYDYEEEGKEIPIPSQLSAFTTENGSFVTYVACNTLEYQDFFVSNKEKIIKILDNVPTYKLGYIMAYIQGLMADE